MGQNAGEVITAVSDNVTSRLLEDAFGNCSWQSFFFDSAVDVLREMEKPKESMEVCVILLVGVPFGMEPAAFYKEVRERSATLPFMMISFDPEISDIKIPKRDVFHHPFRMGALLDRIEKHMNRECMTWMGVTITIGPWQFSPENSTLLQKDADNTISLTEKERDILMKLYHQKGRPLDRGALLNDLWGYVDGIETHTLETHIYRLRKKIEQDPADPKFLVTDGVGYRLVT